MKRRRSRKILGIDLGNEPWLRPTPTRVLWLCVGLLGALVLGFVMGLTMPRERPGLVESR